MKHIFGRKILIISPHPDDEALGCGGLLARAKEEKISVFVLYMCVGSCRQLVTGETATNIRQKEVTLLADYLGFDYRFVFVGDQFMRLDAMPQKELIDPIEDTIQSFKPDSVFLPMGSSYDQDHRALFTAAFTALRPTPRAVRFSPILVAEYEEPYSWQVGGSFVPNCYLDLAGKNSDGVNFLDEKIKIYSFHETQVREEPFARSKENIVRLAKVRGTEAGVEAAEAFRIHRAVAI